MSKIKKNTVRNLKAISDFTADFNGCSAIITGKNDGGKSSFIKSLMDRLRGIKPPIVLKTGTDEGFQEIELTTGEVFRWIFENKTAKGERLIYITKDDKGNDIKQSISAEIITRFFPPTFDIDEFLQGTPAKQRKIMQNLVGIDFGLIDDRYKVAYEERTYKNKKLADAKVNLQAIDEKLPDDEYPLDKLQNEIATLDHHNKAYENAEKGVNDLVKAKTDAETEIKRLETLLKAANAKVKETDKRIADGRKWLDAKENQPKGDDVSFQLNTNLQNLIDQNNLIKKNKLAKQVKQDVLQLDLDAKEADKAVKAIETEKTEMIKKANMPEGFGFTDDGITYNGLPVDKAQISSSEIYIAALKLALMKIGEVRTLHFDASLLDKNKLQDIEKWANENDLQLLIEKVDFDGGEITYELIDESNL